MTDLREALFRDLYTAVGQMTIRWAALEMAVDTLVAVIFQTLPEGQEEFPQALNRKTRFLRKCFRQIDALTEFNLEAVALIERVTSAASDRKWLIHGVVSNIPEFEANRTVLLRRTQYLKTRVRIEEKNVTLADIDSYSIQFLMLMNEVNHFGRTVKNKLNKADN